MKLTEDTTIGDLIEEFTRIEENYHLLATEMVYEGNSVQWWRSKALAYKAALSKAWDALHAAGIKAAGKTDVAAGIAILSERGRKDV